MINFRKYANEYMNVKIKAERHYHQQANTLRNNKGDPTT